MLEGRENRARLKREERDEWNLGERYT